MGRWITLAVGVLLVVNGFYTRTFDFPNETPVRYCFWYDSINFGGCFHNATAPILLAWGPFLLGVAIVGWSIYAAIRGTRRR